MLENAETGAEMNFSNELPTSESAVEQVVSEIVEPEAEVAAEVVTEAAEPVVEPEVEAEAEVVEAADPESAAPISAAPEPAAPKMPDMNEIISAIQELSGQFMPEGFPADMVQPSVREFSIPGQGDNPDTHVKLASIQLPGMGGMPEPVPQMEAPLERPLDYSGLSGFDETIRAMRNLGIGMQKDPAYQELVKLLNSRHGLDRAPAPDALLFRSHAREDATRFMEATAGELDLPMVRMVMEESAQGMPALVVMTQTGVRSPLNKHRTEFVQPAVLLIQDIDLWGLPVQAELDPEHKINVNRFIVAQMSKGAREAMSLIRSGLDNPDVQVLVSTQLGMEIDPYFLTMLEPFTMIDIDLPTPGERADIWMDIMKEHPSMRHVDAPSLVRYTEGMPRYDIYMAAREALEEAYRIGLASGRYFAVSQQLIMEKLANFQPLDSPQYHDLEEAVIYDFVRNLDEVEYYINANGADW